MRKLLGILLIVAGVASALAQSTPPPEPKVQADILFNEGNALFKKGDYQGAIEKYSSAIALAPDYKYHYQLGLSYKNSRQMDKAIAEFENSIKLKNDFTVGYLALGGAYLTTAEYAKSIEAFKSVLKLEPKNERAIKAISEAYAGNAQYLINEGKFEEAGRELDGAMVQEYDNPKLYLLAARIYNRLGQPEKAFDAAEHALKTKKRGSRGAEYFELGVALKGLQQYAKAREAFNEARKDPSYAKNAQYELDGLKGK